MFSVASPVPAGANHQSGVSDVGERMGIETIVRVACSHSFLRCKYTSMVAIRLCNSDAIVSASNCDSSNFDHLEYESILEADFIEIWRTAAGSTVNSQEPILRDAAGPGLSMNSRVGNGSRLVIAITDTKRQPPSSVNVASKNTPYPRQLNFIRVQQQNGGHHRCTA